MKKKTLMTFLVLTGLCLALLLMPVGCKKKSATADSNQPASVSAVDVEQKMCPVLDAPIDKNIYVDYQGKRVYFCCADCKAKFEKEPEKYVSKLPQFAK
jgi:YHS domain-containing protein